jgi:NADH-quinone oxidoreductase subunit E
LFNGTEDLMDYTCEKLGVKWTKYSRWTFEVKGVECLGMRLCPMMQLGDFTKNLTEEKIDQLIIDCKR